MNADFDFDPGASVPEVALWRAVILQALDDMSYCGSMQRDILPKEEAIRWLDSRDFVRVCLNANLEPGQVRKRARQVIASGIPFIDFCRLERGQALDQRRAEKIANMPTPEERERDRRLERIGSGVPPEEVERLLALPDNEWVTWWNSEIRRRRAAARWKTGRPTLSAEERLARKREQSRAYERRKAQKLKSLGPEEAEAHRERQRAANRRHYLRKMEAQAEAQTQA